MRGHVIFLLILALGLIGIASADIYVDDDNAGDSSMDGTVDHPYDTVQRGIDNATTGETVIVWNGTYAENVLVNKTVSLIGNGTADTIIDVNGIGDGMNISADWVNVTGFTLTGAGSVDGDSGIEVFSSENCVISYCNVSDNGCFGIVLKDHTANCTITSNTASSSNIGIYLSASSNNNISGNTASSNNVSGIYLIYSSNNNIVNNTASSNSQSGIHLFNSCNNNEITNNTVNSNSIYGIYLITSSNYNNIVNNTASSNSFYGIYLIISCNYNNIVNNTVSSNAFYGIYLTYSSNNIVANNTANSNYQNGISLYDSSNNTVENNTVGSNSNHGMYLESSNNNVITNNTASANSQYGIVLSSSSNNIVANNTASSNTHGIYLFSSSNYNTIANNTASSNSYGIYLSSSSNNRIHQNDFIMNTNHAFDDNDNIWNLTYPGGGNYWDDYTGVDHLSGPDQDEDGSDGFGDDPYIIGGGGGGWDHYPLVSSMDMPLTGNIVFTSHSNGAFVKGTVLVEVATTWSVKEVRLLLNGNHTGTSITTPHQFFIDTTLLIEDSSVPLQAEAVLVTGPIVSTSITLNVNNHVLTGDFLKVDAIRSTYSPDDTASVIVDVTPAPSYDNLELVIEYEDPNGTTKVTIEEGLPVKSSYIVGLPVFSHAVLGTYNVTVNAYGYNGTALIWNSTNWTYFEVSKKGRADELQDIDDQLAYLNQTLLDLQTYMMGMNASLKLDLADILSNLTTVVSKLDIIDASVADLDTMLSGMNTTLVGFMDDLSVDLNSVGSSLTQRIGRLETNLTTLLSEVNTSLASRVQDLLSTISGDIAGLNASLSDEISSMNVSADVLVLRQWLEMVLEQMSTNLSGSNSSLHLALDDLDVLVTSFFDDLETKLNELVTDLSNHSSDVQDDIDVLEELIDTLSERSLSNISIVLSDMDTGFADIDSDIAGILTSIDALEIDLNLRLDDINASLTNILMIETILDHVESLDESMAAVEEELADDDDDEDPGMSINTVLLVVVIVLLVLVLLDQMTGFLKVSKNNGGSQESVPPKATHDEETRVEAEIGSDKADK